MYYKGVVKCGGFSLHPCLNPAIDLKLKLWSHTVGAASSIYLWQIRLEVNLCVKLKSLHRAYTSYLDAKKQRVTHVMGFSE